MRIPQPWLLLGFLALSAPGARAEVLELGISSRGLAVWFGNVIEPPISISVRFRMAGPDTIFEQLYVNGLPTLAEPREEVGAAAKPLNRIQLLAAAARESTSLDSFRSMPRADRLAALARIYSRQRQLVDSCTVFSDEVIRAHWRGGGHNDFFIPRFPTPPLAQRARQILETGQSHLAMLRRDCAILFGGPEIIVPPNRRAALMQEISRIRSGEDPTGRSVIIKDGGIQAQVRHPRPLPP